MMTAVGTLLAALVALASFLVSQEFMTGSPSTNDPGGPGPAVTDGQGKKLDGQVLWSSTMLLAYIDLDAEDGPDRDPETFETDLFYWRFEDAISAPAGMTKWTGGGAPSQSQCASVVATHGVGGNLSFEEGDRFCLKTNKSRIASFVVLGKIDTGWEVDATVWKQRLSAP